MNVRKKFTEIEPFPKQTTMRDFFKPTATSAKPDLFKKETIVFKQIPGLSLTKNFITEAEESFLWREINKLPWETDIKRRYQIHGYHYETETHDTLSYIGKLPEFLSFLTKRLVDEGLLREMPDQSVINEYEPGQGIGPHIDRSMYHDQVIMVSLGSDIVMDWIGPNEEKVGILLPRRSAVLAEGKARFEWKHGIAHRKTDKLEDGFVLRRGKRISVTLRVTKEDERGQKMQGFYKNRNPEQQSPDKIQEGKPKEN